MDDQDVNVIEYEQTDAVQSYVVKLEVNLSNHIVKRYAHEVKFHPASGEDTETRHFGRFVPGRYTLALETKRTWIRQDIRRRRLARRSPLEYPLHNLFYVINRDAISSYTEMDWYLNAFQLLYPMYTVMAFMYYHDPLVHDDANFTRVLRWVESNFYRITLQIRQEITRKYSETSIQKLVLELVSETTIFPTPLESVYRLLPTEVYTATSTVFHWYRKHLPIQQVKTILAEDPIKGLPETPFLATLGLLVLRAKQEGQPINLTRLEVGLPPNSTALRIARTLQASLTQNETEVLQSDERLFDGARFHPRLYVYQWMSWYPPGDMGLFFE